MLDQGAFPFGSFDQSNDKAHRGQPVFWVSSSQVDHHLVGLLEGTFNDCFTFWTHDSNSIRASGRNVSGVVLELVSAIAEPIKQLDVGQVLIIQRVISQVLRNLDAEERTE